MFYHITQQKIMYVNMKVQSPSNFKYTKDYE